MNISFFITWRNTSSSSRKLDEEEEEEEEKEEEEGEEDSDGSIDTPSFSASRQNDYQIVLHTLTLTLLLNENESSLLFSREYGLWSVKFIKLFKVKGPFFFFWMDLKKEPSLTNKCVFGFFGFLAFSISFQQLFCQDVNADVAGIL